MNENRSGIRINIGIASLILIFIILCLSVFGLLSVSTAKSDYALSKRSAEAITEYYRACSLGEEFLKSTDKVLMKNITEGAADKEHVITALGKYYNQETDRIMTDIPMDKGQALHIELAFAEKSENRYDIVCWKVYNQEEYDIDNSMPVWDGN